MPRLTKEESDRYRASIIEGAPKVLSAIKKIAKTSKNKVKRADILAELGEYFEERLINPIFSALLRTGHICKTGAIRGRGSRWGIPSDAPKDLDALALVPPTSAPAPPEPPVIKVAGAYAHFAAAVLRARVPKTKVIVVKSEKDADYVANTCDTRRIKYWFSYSQRRK